MTTKKIFKFPKIPWGHAEDMNFRFLVAIQDPIALHRKENDEIPTNFKKGTICWSNSPKLVTTRSIEIAGVDVLCNRDHFREISVKDISIIDEDQYKVKESSNKIHVLSDTSLSFGSLENATISYAHDLSDIPKSMINKPPPKIRYRFKTKEEFIVEGRWRGIEGRGIEGCPEGWNRLGKMNHLLGKKLPTYYNKFCQGSVRFKVTIKGETWLIHPKDVVKISKERVKVPHPSCWHTEKGKEEVELPSISKDSDKVEVNSAFVVSERDNIKNFNN